MRGPLSTLDVGQGKLRMPNQFIYARVSTIGQTTDAQAMELVKRYPNAKLVTETGGGAKKRPILETLVETSEPGDELIIAGIDRLGRRVVDVIGVVEKLQTKGVKVISVREGADFSTAVGKLILGVLASVAEMERALISERTIEGLKAAKAKGKSLGAKPRFDANKLREAALTRKERGQTMAQVAEEHGCSVQRLWQLVKSKV